MAERERGRVAKANVQAVKDAAVGGSGQSMVDMQGGEAVKARVNGETVILIKKPKAAPPSTSSGSHASVVPEGMRALDIHDDSSSKKSEKKGR